MKYKQRPLGWFPGDPDPMAPVTVKTLMDTFGRHPWSLKQGSAQSIVQATLKAYTHDKVDAALDFANMVLDGYGVEAIRSGHVDNYYYDVRLLYVNQGDPYASTLVYDTKYGKFGVTTWGDWVEWAEATGEKSREE